MMPSKVARTTERDAMSWAAASEARACATMASASATARVVSSISRLAATPRSKRSRARARAAVEASSAACARPASACCRCTSAAVPGMSNRTRTSPRAHAIAGPTWDSTIRAASGATTTSSAPGAGVTTPAAWTVPRIVPSVTEAVFTVTTLTLSTSSGAGGLQPAAASRPIESTAVVARARIAWLMGGGLRRRAPGRPALCGRARWCRATADGRRALPAAPAAARRSRTGPARRRPAPAARPAAPAEG